MEYTKKFWNDGTFSPTSKGYIGISEGVAYNYYNDKKIDLIDNNYYTNLLLSSKNFYRDFNTKLELPYKKSDIQLAANDFLYSSIINDIVNKLQLNNQYIYQNSIIADGKLNVSESKSSNELGIKQQSINDADYNISVLDNKIKTHYIKNNNGTWSDKASFSTLLSKNNGGYKDSTFGPTTKEEIIKQNWLYDAAENVTTYNTYHNSSTIQKEIIIDSLTNKELNNIKDGENLETTILKSNLNSDGKLTTHLIEFNCLNTSNQNEVLKAVKSLFEIDSITKPFSSVKTIYLRLNSITFLSSQKPKILYAHRTCY